MLLWGKRWREIGGGGREIFAANQVGLERMTVIGQVLQQTSEPDQIIQAGCGAQVRVLIAQRAEPAQEMGVAAQLRKLAHFGESRGEIGEESAVYVSIV